jgi:acetyltransferase-like isoleucine patch superfamily enzyme
MHSLIKAIKYPLRKIKEVSVWTLKELSRNKIKSDFFKKCKYNNVTIQKRARFSGVEGIEIGENSIFYDNSITCAGYLLPHEKIYSQPSGRIRLGKNCTLLPGAIVATYGGIIEIGDEVSINPNVIIYGNGNVTIGSKTRIAAQTVIVSQNHIFTNPSIPIMEQGLSSKGIKIGSDVWIGAGVRILDGVEIGDGSVIGAGAVVTSDIPQYSVAVGVPAKVISKRGRF